MDLYCVNIPALGKPPSDSQRIENIVDIFFEVFAASFLSNKNRNSKIDMVFLCLVLIE